MKVCVFLSARNVTNPLFEQVTTQLAQLIAKERHQLIYGGSQVGLMKTLAAEALRLGVHTTGVMSEEFNLPGIVHDGLDQLFIVKNMHERISKQIELADLFVVLPGGVGTIDEFIKVTVLNKIGHMRKPVVVINSADFYAPARMLLNNMVQAGCVKAEELELVHFVDTVPESLHSYRNSTVLSPEAI